MNEHITKKTIFSIEDFTVIVQFITDVDIITTFPFISKKCKETFDSLKTTLLPLIPTLSIIPIELTVMHTLTLLKILKYFPNANCIRCDTDTARILPDVVFNNYDYIEMRDCEEPLNCKEQSRIMKAYFPKLLSLSIKIDDDEKDFPSELHFSEMTSLEFLSITFTQNENFDFLPRKMNCQQFSRLHELKQLETLQMVRIICEQNTAIMLAPILREINCKVNVILLYSEDNVDEVKEVMSENVTVSCEYDSTMTEYTRRKTIILQNEGLSLKVETVGSMHLFEEIMERTLASQLVLYERVPKWMRVVDITSYINIQSLHIEGKGDDTKLYLPPLLTSLRMNCTGYTIANLNESIPLKHLKLDSCDLNPKQFNIFQLENIEIKSCQMKTTYICPLTVTHFSIAESDLSIQLNDGLISLELGSYNRVNSLQLPKTLQYLSTETSIPLLSLPNLKKLDISKLQINVDLYPTTLTSLRIIMGHAKKQMDLTKFKQLQSLSFIVCEKMKRITLPTQLKYLMLYGCKDMIALDNLKNSNLEELCITDCSNLQIKVPPSVKRCFVDVPSQSTVLF